MINPPSNNRMKPTRGDGGAPGPGAHSRVSLERASC
jgi:hypothetical protein